MTKLLSSEGVGFESEDNIGGCFETVEINGDTLTLKTYIVADADGKITQVDEYVVTKELGENEITFTGDNTTSEAEYALNVVPSFLCLAAYAIANWLPRFFIMLPELLYSVIEYDVF